MTENFAMETSSILTLRYLEKNEKRNIESTLEPAYNDFRYSELPLTAINFLSIFLIIVNEKQCKYLVYEESKLASI